MIHRHRLFTQIWLAFVVITVLCMVGAGAVVHFLHGGAPPVFPPQPGPPPHLLGLVGVAGLMALGTYPVARGITRRLETLRRGVEDLGHGDLAARVPVQGRDEVAALARSFNKAAERIEALVRGQRHMLASASHELRSPLARLRLSVELLAEAGDEAQRATHLAEAVRDVAELDRLVEDLLLVGRLEAGADLRAEPVDLLALAAEEAARADGEAEGDPLVIAGSPTLLRAMLRNLLENARRHGAPPVTVTVRANGPEAVVEIRDAGPGVPPEERERIFAPFVRGSCGRVGGAGLGLALVRGVAVRHGGRARCGDGPGGHFVVELPLAGDGPEALRG